MWCRECVPPSPPSGSVRADAARPDPVPGVVTPGHTIHVETRSPAPAPEPQLQLRHWPLTSSREDAIPSLPESRAPACRCDEAAGNVFRPNALLDGLQIDEYINMLLWT